MARLTKADLAKARNFGYALGGRPKPRPAPRPRPRTRGLTVDQWAQNQAQKYIDAQIAGIEEQRQVFLDELRKQSELEAQRGLALAQALQGMNFGGRVADIYGSAAGDIAGLAGGFSEGLRGQAAAQAAEQANMLSGTGQEGAVRNEGVGMGDVLYGTEGYIPGRSMAETGAAFGAQAALEPSFAARIGQLEAARTHQEGLEGLDQFTQALIEARSGRPDLVEKFRSMRMEAKDTAWKQRFEMLKWQADQHYRNYMLALERGDRKQAMREYQLAVRKQNQAEREANREFGLDVRQHELDVREQDWRENPRNPSNARGGRLTPTQKRDAMKDVVGSRDDIAKAATEVGKKLWKPGAPFEQNKKAIREALYKQFKHLTMGSPAAQRRLRKMIREAVDQAAKMGPPAPGSESGSGSAIDDILKS